MHRGELQRAGAVEISLQEARLSAEPPVSRNAFVRRLFDGLYSLSRRSLFLSALKMEEVMLLGRERCVLQAQRVAARFDALCAGKSDSLRFAANTAVGASCAFAILWFLLQQLFPDELEQAALVLALLSVALFTGGVLLASLSLSRYWRRLRGDLASSGLLERFALGDEELLAIHRYAVKPFGWLALGGPTREPGTFCVCCWATSTGTLARRVHCCVLPGSCCPCWHSARLCWLSRSISGPMSLRVTSGSGSLCLQQRCSFRSCGTTGSACA